MSCDGPKIWNITAALAGGLVLWCAPAEGALSDMWQTRMIFGVEETYDDNVSRAAAAERDDFITKLTAGVGLQGLWKTGEAAVRGTVEQELFADDSDLNNTAGKLTADFQQDPSELDRIKVTESLVHAEEPLNLEEAFGRTSGRYTYTRNRLAAQYRRLIGKWIEGRIGYGNEIYEVSRSDIPDSVQHAVELRGDLEATERTSLIADYAFTTRDYSPGGSAHIHNVTSGVKQYLTERTYLEGRAGPQFIDGFGGESETDVFLLARLTDELDAQTETAVEFRRETVLNESLAALFETWRLGGGVNRHLMERLVGSAWIFLGNGEYDGTGIEDDYAGATLSLNYEFTPYVMGVVGYTFNHVDSSASSRDYDQNRMTVGIRGEF